MVLLLALKEGLKNEKFEFCPLCGSKKNLVFEEQNDKEPSGLDLVNMNDWLLP